MPICILHLSDIQYGRHHVDKPDKNCRPPLYPNGNYSVQLNKLTTDLDILREQGVQPNLIVVTGDIAEWSVKKEYDDAMVFLGGLTEYLGIDRRFVVMVPGNHDINRNLCQAARLIAEADGKQFIPPYFPKFKYYSDFFKSFYENAKISPSMKRYEFREDRLFENFYFQEYGIAFVGLNSCIDLSELKKPKQGNITVDQLKKACGELNGMDPRKEMLRVAVMHHNFLRSSFEDQENLKDADELKMLLLNEHFSLILHGHQHVPRQEVAGQGNRVIHVLATGSAGLDAETIPEIARRYQIIRIDNTEVKVYRRCFDNNLYHVTGKGCWKPDMDPAQVEIYDEFTFPATAGRTTKKFVPPVEDEDLPLIIPEEYRTWVRDQCGTMDIDWLREKGRVIQVNLPEVFIPLLAIPPGSKKSLKLDNNELKEEREEARDIEGLIDEGPYLLVEGQAGSGKTTLMKHFCLTRLSGQKGENSPERLPVLVFLNSLNSPTLKDELSDKPTNADTFELILDHYFKITGCGLSMGIVKAFCRAGRALFLLDGLDEIDPELRNLLAGSLANFRSKYKNPQVTLSGRPHGLAGNVVDLFGKRHISILPLNSEQVEEFVRQWFCCVMNQEEAACLRTAEDMLSEMRDHPAVDDLKDTPLMLTAICMLYLDSKELPGQRAELYGRFINVLLYHRFPKEAEKVLRFLMMLALAMHTARTRAIDQCKAEAILSTVYPQEKDETEDDYRSRLKSKFASIEQNCGLLKLENGQYSFRHLTFQEYLTAVALVEVETESYSDVIKDFWGDDWYREVVQLYIGHLSINNGGMANKIVRLAIEAEDEPPYVRWRLAAHSLNAIHKDSRDTLVGRSTTDRLIMIMGSTAKPKDRVEAGEILGRLSDTRDLEVFVLVSKGRYKFSQGTLDIQPFEMTKYPVTNQWFRKFYDAGGYQTPEYWTPGGLKWLELEKAKEPAFWYDRQWNCPNAPVVGVSWYEADAFTRWLTLARKDGWRYFLPDENQWEAAAAGKEGRTYPWGNEWQEDHCNSGESGIKKTSPVGIFPKGNTAEGIVDMSGNVWEWTSTQYESKEHKDDFILEGDSYKEGPVLRGGSWNSSRYGLRCAYRNWVDPDYRYYDIGFRCARIKH